MRCAHARGVGLGECTPQENFEIVDPLRSLLMHFKVKSHKKPLNKKK